MFTCSSNSSEIVKSIDYVVRAISKGYVYVGFVKTCQSRELRAEGVKADTNGRHKTTFLVLFSTSTGLMRIKNVNIAHFLKMGGGGLTPWNRMRP